MSSQADPLLGAPNTDSLRIALLADTHGGLDTRIQAIVGGCDLAVHGGDIGGAGVLALLQPRLGRVLAVFGNNDTVRQWPSEDRELVRHLPEWIDQPLPGGHLSVIHGHQAPARNRHLWLRRRFPEARVLVYGHSHLLAIDTTDTPWVLNPGAAGRVRTHGGPSCLVLAASTDDWAVEVHRFIHPRQRSARTARAQTR